jgi:Family of unknown function (DUF5996)
MSSATDPAWPPISYATDHQTFEALHLMTQIVGKVRLALTPWINHSWQVTLSVSGAGLATSAIPYEGGAFELEFDFLRHRLRLRTSAGTVEDIALQMPTIAAFHRAVLDLLAGAGIDVKPDGRPNELPEAVPFAEDRWPRTYDADAARRLWLAWLNSHRVLTQFRSGFLGKVSPVHFFWGSFDLAVTRFSGRRAPLHPGGVPNLPDAVAQEAYSHEVASAGFWSGGPGAPFPLFYAYAYPEPAGYRKAGGLPKGAAFHSGLQEYVLPYDCVREAADPDGLLLDFLQASYVAAADAAAWDRKALECEFGRPRVVRKI